MFQFIKVAVSKGISQKICLYSGLIVASILFWAMSGPVVLSNTDSLLAAPSADQHVAVAQGNNDDPLVVIPVEDILAESEFDTLPATQPYDGGFTDVTFQVPAGWDVFAHRDWETWIAETVSYDRESNLIRTTGSFDMFIVPIDAIDPPGEGNFLFDFSIFEDTPFADYLTDINGVLESNAVLWLHALPELDDSIAIRSGSLIDFGDVQGLYIIGSTTSDDGEEDEFFLMLVELTETFYVEIRLISRDGEIDPYLPTMFSVVQTMEYVPFADRYADQLPSTITEGLNERIVAAVGEPDAMPNSVMMVRQPEGIDVSNFEAAWCVTFESEITAMLKTELIPDDAFAGFGDPNLSEAADVSTDRVYIQYYRPFASTDLIEQENFHFFGGDHIDWDTLCADE